MIEGFAVRIVDAKTEDVEKYVMATWLNSYERVGRRLNRMTRREYYRTHHPELTKLFRRTRVALAYTVDDPDVFGGWACGDTGVLHYVFVGGGMRRGGIGGELVRAVSGDELRVYTFTPRTPEIQELAQRKQLKYHAHPIPGAQVQQQRTAREA